MPVGSAEGQMLTLGGWAEQGAAPSHPCQGIHSRNPPRQTGLWPGDLGEGTSCTPSWRTTGTWEF